MTIAHPFRLPGHLELNCSTETRTLMRHRDISTIKFGYGPPLAGRRLTALVQDIKEAKSKAQPNRGHAERAAQIAEHLTDKLIQLGFVELRHHRLLADLGANSRE